VTAWVLSAVVSVGLAVLVGWAIPAWAMKRLLPVLEGSGHLVTNYRGRRIPTGLGLVWLVWAAGVGAATAVVSVAALGYSTLARFALPPAWLFSSPWNQATAGLSVVLVVGAAAFGLVDDAFGTHGSKGFSGHLKALARGELTTGALKLFGIGALAVFAAPSAANYVNVWYQLGSPPGASTPLSIWIAGLLCAVLVIALCANLVNLTDLRPGRALKSYVVLAVAGVIVTIWGSWIYHLSKAAMNIGVVAGSLEVTGSSALVWIVGLGICVLVLVLGPVFAVWRYDLGERAMLGDAGANAMGALAGFLLVWRSPLWLIVTLAVLLLALNLASERFSFSRVIEKVAFLKWIDGLGRLPAVAENGAVHGGDNGTRTGGSAAEGDDARKDGGS
jgi:UDP-GlcNAc:undecaprenyl-phosphate/decaprenyl-phosphate GlcNAc-1-phosphate transferase